MMWVEDLTFWAGGVEAVVRCCGLPLVRAEASLSVPNILVVNAVSSIVESSASSLVKANVGRVGCVSANIEMSEQEGVLLSNGEGGSECSRDRFLHLVF